MMSNKTNIAIEKLHDALQPHERAPKDAEPIITTPAYVGPFKRHYVERVVALAEHAAAYHVFDMDVQAEYLFESR